MTERAASLDSTRRDLERIEEASLAPYALRSSRAHRARRLDPEGRAFDYRTEFQRDRDRIVHSRAFRRLRLKCEGGDSALADGRRDRLTHTLEVCQIARTVARALAANEDLAEAIALGHALGSPPFGPHGEAALAILLGQGPRSLPGGFRSEVQALRVADLIEKRYDHPGLNLTSDLREGILKARGTPPPEALTPAPGGIASGIDLSALRPGAPPSVEARIVAVADRVAGVLGFLDDELRRGAIEPPEVEGWPIVRALLSRLGARYPASSRRRRGMKANVIHRGLTHLLVTALIEHSRRSLRAWCRDEEVEGPDAFEAARDRLPASSVGLPARAGRLFAALEETLDSRRHGSTESALAEAGARRILAALLEAYHRDPRLLDDYVLLRFKEASGGAFLRDLPARAMETEIARRYHGSGVLLRLISDHMAGMTDAYAQREFARLAGATPSEGVAGPLP